MSLCKYKDSLGKPGKGIHSYRIFNIAIMDVLLTLLAAFLISFLWKISFWLTSIILFLLGIFLHRLFCVRTTIDKLLFH
jgi:fatty acid desaturase